MIKQLLNMAFPYIPVCVVCSTEKHVSDYLCPQCADEMAQLAAGSTRVYGYAAHSAYKHDGAAAKTVHAYKYSGARWLSCFMAKMMIQSVCKKAPVIDCICHVPLHAKRRRKRGFDQAGLLAQNVAQLMCKPFVPALRRIRNTPTQTQLNSAERLSNVEGAFESAMAVSGHVLLIDDVLTTGATAAECARVLEMAGAKSVTIATFAQTVLQT